MSDQLIETTLYRQVGTQPKQLIAPVTLANLVKIENEAGQESTVLDEIIALRKAIAQAIADATHFKGAVTRSKQLPNKDYKAGWQYTVAEAGTYAGQACEVGDLIVCIRDFENEFKDSDWNVLQANAREVTDQEIDSIDL
jgi:hypothetical protein